MKHRSTHRKLWTAIIILSVILAGTLLSRCKKVEADYPRDEAPKLDETWSFGSGNIKVVRIPLEGVIMRAENEGLFTTQPDIVRRASVKSSF